MGLMGLKANPGLPGARALTRTARSRVVFNAIFDEVFNAVFDEVSIAAFNINHDYVQGRLW